MGVNLCLRPCLYGSSCNVEVSEVRVGTTVHFHSCVYIYACVSTSPCVHECVCDCGHFCVCGVVTKRVEVSSSLILFSTLREGWVVLRHKEGVAGGVVRESNL